MERKTTHRDGYTNRYGLTECPEWRTAFDALGRQKPQRKDALPMWSNGTIPPAIGSVVKVRTNGIGSARVLGYFVEYGYLGLHVLPSAGADCCVFGAEVNIG